MSYSYQSARALPRDVSVGWVEPDLTNYPLYLTLNDYRRVYITYHRVALNDTRVFDLHHAIEVLGCESMDQSIQEWLIWLGNRTIPDLDSVPPITESKIRYWDVWTADCQVTPTRTSRSNPKNLPKSELRDLIVSKEGVDYQKVYKHLIAVVNGYCHRVGVSKQGVVIPEGGRTGLLGNDNRLGFLDFSEIGEIETYAFTPDLIHKIQPQHYLKDKMLVKLPKPAEGYTILLSLGGYLHILDSYYRLISDTTMEIRLADYPFLERLMVDRHQLDISRLRLDTVKDRTPDQWELEEIYSDETVMGYMTLPQTFMIYVPKSDWFIRKQYMEHIRQPGRYITQDANARLPMIGGRGQVMNYHVHTLSPKRIVCTLPDRRYRYQFKTRPYHDDLTVTDITYSGKPWEESEPYFLETGSMS